jgi:hypothetical protein
MSRFQPSFFSDPGKPEVPVLLVNPTKGLEGGARWTAKDGTTIFLSYPDKSLTIEAPEKLVGTVLRPGTKGYLSWISSWKDDWDAEAGIWATYVNWPIEREELEKAFKAGSAVAEVNQPTDPDGNPIKLPDPPGKVNLGLVIGISMLVVAAIGGTIYLTRSRQE